LHLRKIQFKRSQGIAPFLKVYIDMKGTFVKGNIYSFMQIKRGFPVPDSELNAVKIIKDLTEMDFPKTQIYI